MDEKSFDAKEMKIIQLENRKIGYCTKRVTDSEIYIKNLTFGEKFHNNGFGRKIMSLLIQIA
ncbi:MAG: hypothetical protein WA839_07580 [Flavobacteriaceae bacterium]